MTRELEPMLGYELQAAHADALARERVLTSRRAYSPPFLRSGIFGLDFFEKRIVLDTSREVASPEKIQKTLPRSSSGHSPAKVSASPRNMSVSCELTVTTKQMEPSTSRGRVPTTGVENAAERK